MDMQTMEQTMTDVALQNDADLMSEETELEESTSTGNTDTPRMEAITICNQRSSDIDCDAATAMESEQSSVSDNNDNEADAAQPLQLNGNGSVLTEGGVSKIDGESITDTSKMDTGGSCAEQNNNIVGLKMSPTVQPIVQPQVVCCSFSGSVEDVGGLKRLSSVAAETDTVDMSAAATAPDAGKFVLSRQSTNHADGEPPPVKVAKRLPSASSTVHHQLHNGRKVPTDSSPVSSRSSPTVSSAAAAADYRRSERGLSFLFPSFADHHGMSLIDKVRLT